MSSINGFDPIDPTQYVGPSSITPGGDGHPVGGMARNADMTRGPNPLDNSPLGLSYRLLDHPELTERINVVLNNPER